MIQDILAFVEKPSQYLGTEVNVVNKDPQSVDLRVALAFPDLYEIGTSHFGLQILYHILNQHPRISAERVFAPGLDMEDLLRSKDIPLGSLESGTPLEQFDIIGFSLLYELNYTNILSILELAGIPFLAEDRDDAYPVIIAGGPCMCNPEPVADFFDAVVVGDGEYVIQQMSDIFIESKKSHGIDKTRLLKQWSDLDGVYIPSFYTVTYDHDGFQHLTPDPGIKEKVKRTILSDLNHAPFPEKPVLPFGRPIHDRLRLEVARGCSRGCRFCQAGMIYRPVRERTMDTILSLVETSIPATGYEDISLLSLSTGDYSCLNPLMQHLMNKYADDHIAVSLPSLRADSLTPELMALIKKVRKTGFTIAPEAGSQRLRDIINKNITHQEVLDTVKHAFDLGWNIIKLYFMIGLPFENQDDLSGIIQIVKDMKALKASKGRSKKINVSVTTFIPKAHVPFQWVAQNSLDDAKEKINRLKQQLKMPGVAFKFQEPDVSILEGLFARGDRRLSELLILAHAKGCCFDGWSDKFNFSLWQEAFKELHIDVDFYIGRHRDVSEPLPWDHIDMGVTKAFLIKEYDQAAQQKLTLDCRDHACTQCGVCDFKNTQPVISTCDSESFVLKKSNPFENKTYIKYRFTWTKRDNARFFGHLELVNIFFKAIKRANLPVRFTEGFHPKPRISFNDPLPLGIESLEEHFYAFVPAGIKPDLILKDLNAQLPHGLDVTDCCPVSSNHKNIDLKSVLYDVYLHGREIRDNQMSEYHKALDIEYQYRNKKGKLKNINLKDMIACLDVISPNHLKMEINVRTGKTIRPADILKYGFGFDDNSVKLAKIIKIQDIVSC